MPISPTDLDLVTRTALAEGGVDGDAGIAAVANVVRNRLGSGQFGATPSDVVLAPNQFSAWSLPANDPNNPNRFSAQNPQYQHAAQIVGSVFTGQVPDITGGAQYYGNLPIIAASGKPMPAFTQNPQTAQIGRQTFFASANSGSMITPASQDDVDKIAKSFGVSGGFQPVSSGGGVTVLAPVGSPNASPSAAPAPVGIVQPSQDDVDSIAKAFGQAPAAPISTAPSAPAAPTPAQVQAGQMAPQMGFSGSVVSGMPILGPLYNRALAATGAVLQPMLGANAPPTFGERYAQNLAAQNIAQQQYEAANPVSSTVGNVVGAGMALGPLGETTLGAAALGLPNATRMGATIGGRIWTGMGGGAALGAINSALRGQSPATGAEIGLAGGALGPLVGEGVNAAVNGISNAVRAPAPALAGVNAIGRGWLSNAMANETEPSIAAATERMGPQGFLSDVNPQLTELAAGISNRPEAPASTAIGEAYRTRQVAQRAVTENALTQAFGNKVDLEGFKNMIAENRAAAADPLYEQWRSMQVQPTPELDALMPRLKAAGAFDEAQYLASTRGKPITEPFPTGEQPTLTTAIQQLHGQAKAPAQYPTTETWDLIKRGLNSKIEQAYSGGNKTRAAALIGLKNDLINEVGKTPAGQVWNQARREFADRSALLDQIDAGKDTFLGARSGLSADQMRQELQGLSGPELAARIVGARNAADEVMGATRNGDTTLRNKFLAPANQDKLRLLLGDGPASNLIKTVEQQDYLAAQAKYVNPRAGSPTAPRNAAINALEPPPTPEWNPEPLKPLTLIPPSWVDAMRPSTILQGGRQAAYASARQQIAPVLLARGNALADAIRAIGQEGAARTAAARTGAKAGRAVTAAITGPASQTFRTRGKFSTNALLQAAH